MNNRFYNIFLNRNTSILILLLVVSCVLKIAYLFCCTKYQTYLYSDMGYYWFKAVHLYEGDLFSSYQWNDHPMLMHQYLFFIFKILAFFHLSNYRLESILLLNIFFSTASIYFFYVTAKEVLGSRLLPLIASFLYAFSYPLIFNNIFVLSENIATPLLVLANYVVFQDKMSKKGLFLGGLLLGLTFGVRPNLGIMLIPFSVYILVHRKFCFSSLFRPATFISGFLLVFFLLGVEQYYISKGATRTVAPHGGVSFAIAQCKPFSIQTTYYPDPSGFVHPTFSIHPEFGVMMTDRPWHDQLYFYKIGFHCFMQRSFLGLENLKYFKAMFFDPLFPGNPGVVGFKTLIGISNYLLAIMFLSLGLLILFCRNNQVRNKKIITLASMPLFIATVSFFFGFEQRYLTPVLYALYIIFIFVLKFIKNYKKQASVYFFSLLTIYFSYRACSVLYKEHLLKTYHTTNIRMFPLDSAKIVKKNGSPWNLWENFIMQPDMALLFKAKQKISASEVELSTDANDVYRLDFYSGPKHIGILIVPDVPNGTGLISQTLSLPDEIKQTAFDNVLVRPAKGNDEYSLGHIIFKS